MIPYLITFILSTLVFYVAENTNNKVLKVTLYIFAIIIPSVLAGVRDSSVGTDVNVYGKRFYNISRQSETLLELFANLSLQGVTSEYLFHLLNFVLSRFFYDYHAGLFAYSLITSSFFFLGYVNLKRMYDVSIGTGMIFYYLSLYNTSLNAMRQIIAVSMVFYAVTFLLQDKIVKFFLLFILAFFFHSSAIFGILFLIIYLLVRDREQSKKKLVLRLTIFYGIMFVAAINIKSILTVLIDLGFVRPTYLNYLIGGLYNYTVGGRVDKGFIVLPIIFTVFSLILLNRSRKMYYGFNFYMTITILTLILSFSTYISFYTVRVIYYLMPIEYEMQILNSKCFNKRSRKIWIVIILLFLLVIWLFQTVYKEINETIPYIFMRFN